MTGYTVHVLCPGHSADLATTLYSSDQISDDLRHRVLDARSVVCRIRPRGERERVTLERFAAGHGKTAAFSVAQRTDGTWLLSAARTALLKALTIEREAEEPQRARLGEDLETAIRQAHTRPAYATKIGAGQFRWGSRTYVMGIVNVTPDSFSGDGLLRRSKTSSADWIALAAEQAVQFAEQGADIIDIGGESTRPGAEPVNSGEEQHRVVPAIRAIRKQSDIPISIDTYKADVARAALDAGADMVNDVWGLRRDPAMADLAAQRRVPVIVMHNRSRAEHLSNSRRLGGRYVGVQYDDFMLDLIEELTDQAAAAQEAGVTQPNLIVDPGIGFGKTVQQNLQILNQCDALRVMGQPILLGPSRKSFVGYTLNLPLEERIHGTLATLAVAIARRGAEMVRVHDVEAAVQVVRMADAIVAAPEQQPQQGER